MDRISDVDKVERIRQAVITLRYDVTVGDVVSETGISAFDVERGLKSLLGTHEGVLRVSEHGELLFAFKEGFIERDYRSWWQRSKSGIYKGFKAIYKGFKGLFKVLITLTVIVYFVVYISLITVGLLSLAFVFIVAALFIKKKGSSTGGAKLIASIMGFWSSSLLLVVASEDNVPVYTSIYFFVFGPEAPPVKQLDDGKFLAQLIRSKSGIITLEDWIFVSNKFRKEAENDLARYTSLFDGNAQIMDDGTLVYSFAEMMKSSEGCDSEATSREECSNLKQKTSFLHIKELQPFTGNSDNNNAKVIGLNLFNFVLALFILFYLNDPSYAAGATLSEYHQQHLMYLAYFPLAFSAAIFAIPLFRLPVNMVKNLRRRRDNLRHLAMLVIDEQSDTGEDLYSFDDILNSVNHYLDYLSMPHATTSELSSTLEDLMDDFNAKHKVHKENAKHYYQFDTLIRHQKTARLERDTRGLDKQVLGRVIFSTDAEDVDAEKNANDIEFEDFDKSLESKPKCLNA